ncbi:MAG TPA: NlpC/P60 family protein [Mycobacteriales bacterium]|nr:NlpC/P60 family protein [Mycobacteriales bacterium]
MPAATLRARLGAAAATTVLALTLGTALSTPPAAAATTSTGAAATAHQAQPHHRPFQLYEHKISHVMHVVRNQRGKPYVYGAAGPGAFDCSGLVRYVFGRAVQRWLPHNAEAQYQSVHHIAHRRNLRVGDLVFQESGGYAFHVGIYAGHDKWWHAPHSGSHVRKQQIYQGHLAYGRVILIRNQR